MQNQSDQWHTIDYQLVTAILSLCYVNDSYQDIFSFFFFACPKKKQKKAHENEYCPFSCLFPDLAFALL